MRRDSPSGDFLAYCGERGSEPDIDRGDGNPAGAAVLPGFFFRSVPCDGRRISSRSLAFVATTFLSLAMSPDPAKGWHAAQKVVLDPIGLLAAAFVTTEERAKDRRINCSSGGHRSRRRSPSFNFRSHK